ncbi:hypothetical protein BC939DRAFT_459618 [Gamsiella multidivaricata]|uniref:uncharacterized protein n=1 Tax=Gamsiella multidivaricata TaxID=101098 RepID=UPI00221EED05|nr:uncharacterized protein BC939DRAFT_459618 [Gamsiella multidivaricata]KAI7819732.1 hypothetical protein BC939DRAFT_459618 [Gamsiella multidivaricata]
MIRTVGIASTALLRPAAAAIRSTRSIHTGASNGVTNHLSHTTHSKILKGRDLAVLSLPATIRPYSSFPRAGLRSVPLAAVALILGGLTLTVMGLWQFYTSGVNVFPEAIRNDLRKALYYQNYGNDREKAVAFYRSALNAAMHHPDLRVDGPEVTGIMIQLGTMFQDMGRTHEAIDVLVMTFECLVHGRTVGRGNDFTKTDIGVNDSQFIEQGQQDHGIETQFDQPTEQPQVQHGLRVMDGTTRLKAIGVAQKLGDLYHSIKKDKQAEQYYLWSIEQLMKKHYEIEKHTGDNSGEEGLRNARDQDALQQQFNFEKLPSWMTKMDLGASLEALGGFYTSKGIYSNALPLYMRALSLVDERSCHAAVLMCNISDAFAGLGNIEDATGWAERGLKVGTSSSGQECDEGCGVLLYNLGMLHEVRTIFLHLHFFCLLIRSLNIHLLEIVVDCAETIDEGRYSEGTGLL